MRNQMCFILKKSIRFSPGLAMRLLVFFCLHACLLEAQQTIQVNANIDSEPVYTQRQISGLITVTHTKNQNIDSNTFKLGDTPLKVAFVKEVHPSPSEELTLSIYHFELPAKPKGLQLLAPISVVVDGQTYSSTPSTYEVKPIPESLQPKLMLQLENTIEGANPLYPGQHIRLIYRFYFRGNISLTKESLPMLDVSGFSRLGSKEVKEGNAEGINIQEISQEYAGRTPGIYKFPISYITGYASQTDAEGNTILTPPELRAEAPPLTVIVNPFPAENQPASFNGAVGEFQFNISLKTNAAIHLSDVIELAMGVRGTEGIDTVTLPDLSCQPGFSGFFQIGDMSSVGIVQGPSKYFKIELRPLSPSIKEIPSIEFSYFNPKEKRYAIIRSPPIALTILPQTNKPVALLEEAKEAIPSAVWHDLPTAASQPPINELSGNAPIKPSDLFGIDLNLITLLYLIPAGIFLLLFQSHFRHTLLQKGPVKQITSQELFTKALHTAFATPDFFQNLEAAFLLKLKEKSEIASSIDAYENLPQQGKCGLVREFLSKMDEKRFTGRQDQIENSILLEAKQLFDQLDGA